LYQIKKLPYSKGNNDHSEQAGYRMGEYLSQLLITQRIRIYKELKY
jgi:hypothetical protein